MRIDDLVRQAWRPLRVYKLRTSLSLLGILIGVAAVIALTTLMHSASNSVDSRVESLGTNLIVATMNPLVGASNNQHDMTLGQAQKLGRLPGVSDAAPVDYETTAVSAGSRNAPVTLYGTTPHLADILQYRLAFGRYLTAADVASHLNVTVLGAQTSRQLFGRVNPVGRQVMIDHEPYTVVGVFAAKGAFLTVNQDAIVMTPITTYQDFSRIASIDSVYIQARQTAHLSHALDAVNRQLTAWFGNSGRYTLLTQSAILSVTQQITGLLTHVLVGVAAISVLVGGIGMLNVMLISVSERVREIGLRKSLGAKRRDLLMQFLVEAVIISLSGGILGVGAGVAASLALTSRFHIGAAINPAVPVLALAACVVLGILFGIYPAFRAARMAPAEALRCD